MPSLTLTPRDCQPPRAPASSGAGVSETAAPTLGALLGATLAALTEPTRANAALLSASRAYGRVLAYVDRHLADPALSVSDIAARSGVSRSALYRLFEPVDDAHGENGGEILLAPVFLGRFIHRHDRASALVAA